jgi:hypothetical protein
VRYLADSLGCVSIKIDQEHGKLMVVGHRNAILTGRRATAIMIREDAPLRVHRLVDSRVGVWMSDLPEELQQVEDFLHGQGAYVAGKRVLVGGLGLGIVATRLVQMGATVTVVEKSRSVIRLIRRQMPAPFRVVQADIHTYLRTCEPFDAYYLDTWQGTSEATWWSQVMPLRRLIGQRFGIVPVHCWAEDMMLGQVRRAVALHAEHGPEWHYARLPSGTDPDHFTAPAMGTPAWEAVYGAGLDAKRSA